MEGQILLNILLDNGFKDTTLKAYSDRYPKNELTEVYREFQDRYFEKNNFNVRFHYGDIIIFTNTGMNGFEPKIALKLNRSSCGLSAI